MVNRFNEVMNLQEQISRIQSMMGLIAESNDFEERLYIDWDENYGKSFKIVHTPEGAQSGVEWNPDLVSVVTPENTSAWYEWEELSPKKLLKWKDRWDEVQKTLGDYKYNQIIRSMSNNQEEMMEDNNTRRTDIGRTMDTFTFDDSYDELLGSTYFKFQDYDIWFGSDGEEITDDLTNQILDTLTPQDSYGSYEEWKNSKWYDITGFPFSSKDWSTVTSGEESFKWSSTGHKDMEERIFNSYLDKYGQFIVVNLTDK